MEKEYRPNLEYNRKKRTSALVLLIIYTLLMGGFIAFILIKQTYTYAFVMAIFVIFPFILIPPILKNYPVKDEPLIKLNDKSFTAGGKEYKVKDIVQISANIDLPYSKVDSENDALLQKMASTKAEDIYFGSFDIVVPGNAGKNEVIYNNIDNVIDALNSFIEAGVKHYKLTYSIKKKTITSTYDYRKDIIVEREKEKEELAKLSKKDKIKQLI